jgi:hypothetical protein
MIKDPEGNTLWRLNYRTPTILKNGKEEECSILVRSNNRENVGKKCWKIDSISPVNKIKINKDVELLEYDKNCCEYLRILDKTTFDYTQLCIETRKLKMLKEDAEFIAKKFNKSRENILSLFENLHGFSIPKIHSVSEMSLPQSNCIPEFKIMRSNSTDEVQLGYFIIHWSCDNDCKENTINWKYFQEIVISDSEESVKQCLDLLPLHNITYQIKGFYWNGENSCPIEN